MSSGLPVVLMFSCSLMQSFWLPRAWCLPFFVVAFQLCSDGATAQNFLRSLSDGSPGSWSAKLLAYESDMSFWVARLQRMWEARTWSRRLSLHHHASRCSCCTNIDSATSSTPTSASSKLGGVCARLRRERRRQKRQLWTLDSTTFKCRCCRPPLRCSGGAFQKGQARKPSVACHLSTADCGDDRGS